MLVDSENRLNQWMIGESVRSGESDERIAGIMVALKRDAFKYH